MSFINFIVFPSDLDDYLITVLYFGAPWMLFKLIFHDISILQIYLICYSES